MTIDFKPLGKKDSMARRLSLIKQGKEEDFRLVGELYWSALSTDPVRDFHHEVIWQGLWVEINETP